MYFFDLFFLVSVDFCDFVSVRIFFFFDDEKWVIDVIGVELFFVFDVVCDYIVGGK